MNAARSCEGCKYWSEMIAEAVGGGPVKALCLFGDGLINFAEMEHRMTYRGCEKYEEGLALDHPARKDGFGWENEG